MNEASTENHNKYLNSNNTKMYLNKYNIKTLSDEEINNLKYNLAIQIDKRTYFRVSYELKKKVYEIINRQKLISKYFNNITK